MDHILNNNDNINRNKIIATNTDYIMTTRSNPVTISSKSTASDDEQGSVSIFFHIYQDIEVCTVVCSPLTIT